MKNLTGTEVLINCAIASIVIALNNPMRYHGAMIEVMFVADVVAGFTVSTLVYVVGKLIKEWRKV